MIGENQHTDAGLRKIQEIKTLNNGTSILLQNKCEIIHYVHLVLPKKDRISSLHHSVHGFSS